MASRLSGDPPSQYWNDSTNARASAAFSVGRYLRTLGSVRTSLRRPSSNPDPSWALPALIKSEMIDFFCPRLSIVNLPTLFNRITSGMDGKMRAASRLSRAGSTASTTWGREEEVSGTVVVRVVVDE